MALKLFSSVLCSFVLVWSFKLLNICLSSLASFSHCALITLVLPTFVQQAKNCPLTRAQGVYVCVLTEICGWTTEHEPAPRESCASINCLLSFSCFRIDDGFSGPAAERGVLAIVRRGYEQCQRSLLTLTKRCCLGGNLLLARPVESQSPSQAKPNLPEINVQRCVRTYDKVRAGLRWRMS